MYKKIPLLVAMQLLILSCASEKEFESYTLSSPEGKNSIQFDMNGGSPHYSVNHGATKVILPSSMGFVFKDQDSLQNGLEVINVEESSEDTTWEQVWGEKKEIRNNYNQLTVHLKEKANKERKLDIQFRAFDDGIAFRYVFPEQGIKDSIFIMDELTTFNLAEDGKAWWIPAYDEQRYENLFTASPVSTLDTVHTPLTVESNNGLAISFHEANLADFASTTLAHTQGTSLKTDLVPWADGVKVRTVDNFTTPWRTLQIADHSTELITSYLILNLNEPNTIKDTSWIKTFKYLGIWWGMHIGKYTFWEGDKQGATTKNARKYIDYTKELGIDYLLIEGWNKGWTPAWYENAMHQFSFTEEADNFSLKAVTDYAAENDVEIVGYHETGSNLHNYLKQIDSAFALYKERGINTVKIGQVGAKLNMKEWHHGQFGVNYYRYVVKKAAEYGLEIYFHEPIKDTGERRTYPNMMAREGARGQEYNAWSEGNPPAYTATLPFTRLLAGPMDFTPAVFDVEVKEGYPGRRVHSTTAKQLALMVVFYSPLQMLADLPENYIDKPAFQFLKDVPTDWEDTKVLNGEIGKYITTVRKDIDSNDWYLGTITNEKARDLNIQLDFLDRDATYEAQIYADAPGTGHQNNPTAITIYTKEVTAADSLSLLLGESGGAAVRFKKL
ncbi:glycoside hydrolase family 97 protein [Zunongwangia profunda]|uniref:Alpha-glucosidase n=1 Tax=Zunongwangia profunda TaxID=398743 RepID=A0A3D5IZB3_9FLAO|nr:glycoside hydrolase family 97 protein [Zunongwangia profunda]MAS70332.1 alpha-glucosidase [Zunongwangia sp.]HCV81077.1 alpha-glucosidase [Zunongwangia profunda]|tara:strand:+ start:1361 stop:3367 length:2007 start_codon:yes stop_codon:yes gene_type:complete